ncbi:MAG: hypothetical protein NVSMB31_07080 [Vulcanimicrobiaceae bacterium]
MGEPIEPIGAVEPSDLGAIDPRQTILRAQEYGTIAPGHPAPLDVTPLSPQPRVSATKVAPVKALGRLGNNVDRDA